MRQFILSLCILFSVCCSAQQPLLRDYWLNESATPVKVNAIAQDKTGYIWLGTDEGLYFYNGLQFAKMEDSVHKPVTALFANGNDIWVGFANGSVAQVTNHVFHSFHFRYGPKAAINSIRKGRRTNTLWLGSEAGLTAVVGDIGFTLNESNGLPDDFVYDDVYASPGRMLLGTDRGIADVHIASGKPVIISLTTQQGLPDNIVRIIRKVPHINKYWVGTQQGGIAIYDPEKQKITVPPGKAKWSYGQVNDILPLAESHVWVATEDGFLVEIHVTDTGLVCKAISSNTSKSYKRLLQDKAGNIWCATSTGLTMFTAEYLECIRLDNPYLLHNVTALACDKHNTLWIALKEDLYKVPISDNPVLQKVGNAGSIITSLFIDNNDFLWIGTWGKGLMYKSISQSSLKSITNIPVLNNESILDVTGEDSCIWVAGLNGVEELNFNPVTGLQLKKHHNKQTGIGSDYVYQLYPDSKGDVWMATDGAGVCMYNGNNYQHWDTFFKNNNHVAYTVTEDKFGDIWAGTAYKDLYHLHNNNWENLRKQETRDADINITGVAANATGQVISVYQRCIDEWYPKSNYFRHFNSAMRMGIDSTSSILNCMAKDTAGNVYVPYQHGILIFKNQEQQYDIRPAAHIVHTSVNLKPVEPGKHSFANDENYITFSFEGVNFSNPERLIYRYILEGYNSDWVTTNDASVTFPKLPPGKYKFRVQTSLNNGFENAIEDNYDFFIAAPFWKMPWFIILVVLTGIGLVYLYLKSQRQRVEKIAQLQQERLMFEYEHLKSQVNPHFLFNSLNTLTGLIEDDKDNAVSYTSHLSDLYRNMLEHRNEDLISLSEECEILNNYVHIQESRFGSALSVQINITPQIMQEKKVIPLALQLLVENAIKHNVVSAAHPLTITITATENEITISNPLQHKISKEKGAGIGLVNIKKRYKLLTNKPVFYGVHQDTYVVTLPLL